MSTCGIQCYNIGTTRAGRVVGEFWTPDTNSSASHHIQHLNSLKSYTITSFFFNVFEINLLFYVHQFDQNTVINTVTL